jgi:glycerophosphoryl diester phosphodiesterase
MRRTAEPPIIIAHRGASGHRPEHTLAAYALAIDMGADFIEPDLVATKDGRLVARHEPEIGKTTDVAQKFPERKTTRTIDGATTEGWFVCDFTLAEIKTLRARQPWPFRSTAWNGLFEIPTFEEIIALAKAGSARTGRTVGVYPETKHPSFHRALGLPLEEPLLTALAQAGWTEADSPVFIQSFEVGNLRRLATQTGVRLIQLLDEPGLRPFDFITGADPRTYGDLMTPEGLRQIATYAYGIGPWKRSILEERDPLPPGERVEAKPPGEGGVDEKAAGAATFSPSPCPLPRGERVPRLNETSPLIDDAHAAGLRVHAYTFRDEPKFLAPVYDNDPAAEYRQFFELGLDGVFSDFPDTAFRGRAGFSP